jgi:hypothetical protein
MTMTDGMEDRRPIPDPTILTTQQLLRAIADQREYFLAQFEATRQSFSSQIDGQRQYFLSQLESRDRATILSNTHVLEQIAHLERLMLEKFASVGTQFDERDTRVRETATATKVAVDAALQAAEKAVDKSNEAFALSVAKSEAATTKQIDAMQDSYQKLFEALRERMGTAENRLERIDIQVSSSSGLPDRIRTIEGRVERVDLQAAAASALPDRISVLERHFEGMTGRGAGYTASWGIAVAVFGMVIGVGGIILSIVR